MGDDQKADQVLRSPSVQAALQEYRVKLGEVFAHFMAVVNTLTHETQTVGQRLSLAMWHQDTLASTLKQEVLERLKAGDVPVLEEVAKEMEALRHAHCVSLLHVILGHAQGMLMQSQLLHNVTVKDLHHIGGAAHNVTVKDLHHIGGAASSPALAAFPSPAAAVPPAHACPVPPERGVPPPPGQQAGRCAAQDAQDSGAPHMLLPGHSLTVPCAPLPQGFPLGSLPPYPVPPFPHPPFALSPSLPSPVTLPAFPFPPTLPAHQSFPVHPAFQGQMTVPWSCSVHFCPPMSCPGQPPSTAPESHLGGDSPGLHPPERPCLPAAL